MLVARSVQECHLYMELHPCDICGDGGFQWTRHRMEERATELFSVYDGDCPSCASPRRFEFRYDENACGPSQIIDPGEFLALALRAAMSIPDDPTELITEDPDDLAGAADLADLAVETLDEVIAFLPGDDDAVPADAFVSGLGRELHATNREWFRRGHLHRLRLERQEIAAAYDAAVRAVNR